MRHRFAGPILGLFNEGLELLDVDLGLADAKIAADRNAFGRPEFRTFDGHI